MLEFTVVDGIVEKMYFKIRKPPKEAVNEWIETNTRTAISLF